MLHSPVYVSPATAPEELTFFLLMESNSPAPYLVWIGWLVSDTMKLTAGEGMDNVLLCYSEIKTEANFSASISGFSFTWLQLF